MSKVDFKRFLEVSPYKMDVLASSCISFRRVGEVAATSEEQR